MTFSSQYALRYQARDAAQSMYPFLVTFVVVPGTYDSLQLLRRNEIVRRGPTNGFGIPEHLVPWFNRHVIGLQVDDVREKKPDLLVPSSSRHHLAKGDYNVVFQAFSPEYIEGDQFSSAIGMHRMSWIKTSLMWMVWRSNWGRKKGQERIVEIEIQPEELSRLEGIAVTSKNHQAKAADVVYQSDPDRRILGVAWRENLEEHWVKIGSTVHLGLRGLEYNRYVNTITNGHVRDITDVIKTVETERPKHPRQALQDRLGYLPVMAESIIK